MMKTRNRLLALLLTVLLLALPLIPVSAEDQLIDTAEIYMKLPTAGETVGSLRPQSGDPDKFSVWVDEVYTALLDENGQPVKDAKGYTQFVVLTNNDVFQENVDYHCRLRFQAQSGYSLDDVKTTYIINGRKAYASVGVHLCEIMFKPKAPQPAADESSGSCPYCHKDHNGFFNLFVRLFHKLLYRIIGEKK